MSVVWAPVKEYVILPLQREVELFSEDLGNVNSWIGQRVIDVTGSPRAAAVMAVFLNNLVVAVPFFLLPWPVVLGAMAAYQISSLKLPTFEQSLSIAAFIDAARQIAFFAAKNLMKQAGALPHVGNAVVAGLIATSLLIQSKA